MLQSPINNTWKSLTISYSLNLPSEAHFKLVIKIPAWGIPERWRASKRVREELLFSKEDTEKDPQYHVAPLKKLKSATDLTSAT